jgi:predicted lactoylglutathione lyase
MQLSPEQQKRMDAARRQQEEAMKNMTPEQRKQLEEMMKSMKSQGGAPPKAD